MIPLRGCTGEASQQSYGDSQQHLVPTLSKHVQNLNGELGTLKSRGEREGFYPNGSASRDIPTPACLSWPTQVFISGWPLLG